MLSKCVCEYRMDIENTMLTLTSVGYLLLTHKFIHVLIFPQHFLQSFLQRAPVLIGSWPLRLSCPVQDSQFRLCKHYYDIAVTVT